MHFESDRDACLIVAMAVPVIEFAFLFVTDFSYIVLFFSKIFVRKKKNFYRRILFL